MNNYVKKIDSIGSFPKLAMLIINVNLTRELNYILHFIAHEILKFGLLARTGFKNERASHIFRTWKFNIFVKFSSLDIVHTNMPVSTMHLFPFSSYMQKTKHVYKSGATVLPYMI